MSYSSLISGTTPADVSNYTQGRRGYKICKFTPHHMAGVLTGPQCGRIFQNPNRNASSNYGIGNDGQIWGYVDEENRAWTSSSPSNDCQAITVEVSNSSTGGNWPVSDAAWSSLVKLAYDVCKRYNFRLTYDGTPNGSLTRHDMFANTNCPGPYIAGRLSELANTVNAMLDGGSQPAPAPTPAPSAGHSIGEVVKINGIYVASNSTKKLNPARNSGTITKIINGAHNPYLLDNGNLGWTNDGCIISGGSAPAPSGKSVGQLADEVIAGKWGNGSERRARLEAAGYNYSEVQAEVNRKLSGGSSRPAGKSISQLADEVIRGDWGNGNERKRRLQAAGYDYNAVQAEVNRRYR